MIIYVLSSLLLCAFVSHLLLFQTAFDEYSEVIMYVKDQHFLLSKRFRVFSSLSLLLKQQNNNLSLNNSF